MFTFLPGWNWPRMQTLILPGTLVVLLISAIVLRLWHLNSLPVAYYHDELDYVITGQSLRLWGTDLTGDWRAQDLTPVRTLNYTAEVTPLIHAGVQALFGSATQIGRLPGAIFGGATVAVIGLIVWKLTHDWKPAACAAVWVALNPWHVYVSRLGYEAVISLFFQLAFVFAVILVMQARTKKSLAIALVGAWACQWLAYYTYHSAKFLLPALTVLLLIWLWFQRRSWKIAAVTAVVLLGSCLSLLGHSLAIQRAGGFGERQSELVFTSEFLQETVDFSRHQALGIPGMRWWYNKPSVLASELMKRYTSAFDVYRLFVSGYEGGFQFSLAVHGFFALSSIPLIGFGAVWLWRRSRLSATFVFLLMLASPIPSAINMGYQSIFRSALLYVLLAALAGLGAYALWQWLNRHRWGFVAWLFVCALFLAEFFWFGTRYFSRYPIVTADNHYFSQKLLTGYLGRTDQRTHVVLEDNLFSTARSFVFYRDRLSELSQEERQQFRGAPPAGITVGNVHFSQGCPPTPLDEAALYIVEPGQFVTCQFGEYIATSSSQLVPLRSTNEGQVFDLPGLASPIDNRTYYYLLGDQVCPDSPSTTFIHPTQLHLFNPLELSNEELCKNWVKLDPKPVTRP